MSRLITTLTVLSDLSKFRTTQLETDFHFNFSRCSFHPYLPTYPPLLLLVSFFLQSHLSPKSRPFRTPQKRPWLETTLFWKINVLSSWKFTHALKSKIETWTFFSKLDLIHSLAGKLIKPKVIMSGLNYHFSDINYFNKFRV